MTNRRQPCAEILHRLPIAAAVIAVTILTSCESRPGAEGTQASSPVVGAVAGPWDSLATFHGTGPCASCPGIDLTIQFKPDGTAFVRKVYQEAEDGEDPTTNNLARWSLTADSEMIVVRDGEKSAQRFGFVSTDTLTMLDQHGDPIQSDLPYELTRVYNVEALEADASLTGMYQYYADAATVRLCSTGKRYPVAMEEAHVDLESAYLGAVKEAAQPLLASFTGRIETRPAMEGPEERDFVIVTEFEEIDPEGRCVAEDLSVEGTVWSLTELLGKPVDAGDPTKVPNLVLIFEDHQAAGSDGCNRFTGTYTFSGDTLSFGPMASSQMDCPGESELETRYMQALSATESVDRLGNVLELHTGNRLLARFQGVKIEE